MSKRKKNNIIIGSLLAVVLLMAVGYAAFSTVLNIQGTGSISSSWNIKITNVEVSNIVGKATDAEGTTFEDLTATINSNLVSPGDSITYDVTIRNDGTIDAVLTDINLSESTNPAISFSTSNLTEGTELGAGEEAILKVTVTYNDVTSQPEDTTASLDITLTYEQKGSGTIIPGGDSITIGGQDVELVSAGDGLYEDSYESGRYIYKGANPNNYIKFDTGEIWRIISKEADGTYKIVKNEVLSDRAWDTTGGTYGSNNWARPADLNTYLNGEYYESLDSSIKDYVVSHSWGIGAVTYGNNDLATQIASENGTTWTGNIGLISVSDYLRANTNTEQCGTFSLNSDNDSTCKTTDWLLMNDNYWTISPSASSSVSVFRVNSLGSVGNNNANRSASAPRPAAYLSSDITLTGEGTSSNAYKIVS